MSEVPKPFVGGGYDFERFQNGFEVGLPATFTPATNEVLNHLYHTFDQYDLKLEERFEIMENLLGDAVPSCVIKCGKDIDITLLFADEKFVPVIENGEIVHPNKSIDTGKYSMNCESNPLKLLHAGQNTEAIMPITTVNVRLPLDKLREDLETSLAKNQTEQAIRSIVDIKFALINVYNN